MAGDGAFLIWDCNTRKWWAPRGEGLTTDISAAGRYSRVQAMDICLDTCQGPTSELNSGALVIFALVSAFEIKPIGC